jgi:hypothetical protein
MTMVRIGAFSTGRITIRSIRSPPTKAMATVARKVIQ